MCVLGHDGSVSCSGANDIAQLGGGSFGGPASTFARATDANGPIADATAVCSGRDHSCAVRAGGTVWCWGAGGSGQLGNTQYSDSAVAVQVVLDSGEPLAGISELACGHSHSCALASDQTVWCWGDNNNGQIGDNTGVGRATALQVPGLSGVAALASGARFVCTLDTSSQVRCWGDNGAGEIGDGTSNTAYQPSALALANVTAIATGPFHTCALLADSTMQCWGANTRRWLGTGTSRNVSQLSPLPVLETDGVTPYSGAIAIAAGAVTCALRANGHVDCWSDDVHGQSGNGGTALPRPVLDGNHDLTGVDKLTAHYAHVCAHRTDGSIMCWGRNTEGEYGDGTTRNHGSPSPLGASCGSTN
jgi:alpha-tubulin suppressor-like RCC1 family protein